MVFQRLGDVRCQAKRQGAPRDSESSRAEVGASTVMVGLEALAIRVLR